LLWLFWKWDLSGYLPRLTLTFNPLNLSLPSSQNYRPGAWHPSSPGPPLLVHTCSNTEDQALWGTNHIQP
jgi:hypothetical protein